MSSTLRVTNVADTTGGTSTNLMSGLAKAWSNLNGTGTIAERDSFNISGYVDNGTGHYTFTISNDMANANYTGSSSGDNNFQNAPFPKEGTSLSAGSFETIHSENGAFGSYDPTYANIQIFGDLA